MFRFWYRFVLNNKSLIAGGAADLVFRRIEPYFSEYMGLILNKFVSNTFGTYFCKVDLILNLPN